jgi:hypothetical protein
LGILGKEPVGAVGTVFEKQKGSSMKWLKRIVAKWALNDQDCPIETVKSRRNQVFSVFEQDWHENLNIAITNANGGKIITFKRYDHKTDRHDNKIYVVPDDLDFNAELGKLITLESMRG